jgi:DNA replicative helicase MCM subunit Mcm2 (Cdc46/Mcm family)
MTNLENENQLEDFERKENEIQATNYSLNDDGPQALDQQTLKKYIQYARSFVRPIIHNVDSEKIATLYSELRAQSAISGGIIKDFSFFPHN